jgi:phosphonate transport system permease protein
MALVPVRMVALSALFLFRDFDAEPLLPAIHQLPEAQSRALLHSYRDAVAAKRRKACLGFVVVAVLYALAARAADVRPGAFFAHIDNFTSYIVRILPHLTLSNFAGDMASWYWNFGKWLLLLGDTLLAAYVGTLLGAVGAFLLCFAASANLTSSRILRALARRWFEFCRTVPDIVFAMIFLIAFKSGPMAGAVALTVHTMGALGKLFAEVVENIDMKPVEGVTASGASWLQTIRFAVVPQVMQSFASYTLLRFEINVRSASVMGFIGAGGIGQEFIVAIRSFYYSDVSAMLVMIIVTVFVIDLLTERLRHRLAGAQAHR